MHRMNNACLRKTLPLVLLISGVGSAQMLQRLFIPETSIHLGPNGEAEIATLCSDYGIPGPKVGQRYEYLLSGSGSVRLRIGGKPMALDEAIRDGKVKLETPRATSRDYIRNLELLSRLNPGSYSAEQIGRVQRALALMGESDRNLRLADAQNPGRLRLVNLSGEEVEFEAHGALLGTTEQAPAHIPASVMQSGGASPAATTPSQDRLWIAQLQSELADLGYSIDVDGKTGPHTKAAFLDFQRRNGLEADGNPTFATAKKIHEAHAQASLARSKAISSDSDLLVLRVENHPAEANRFRVLSPSGAEVYLGNRRDEMITAIAGFSAPQGKDKYLELANFSQRQQENLATSFRTYADIVAIPRAADDTIIQSGTDGLVMQRGIKLADPKPMIEEVPEGQPRQGLFRMVYDFIVGVGHSAWDVAVDVYSRTREELVAFHGGAFASPGAKLSPDDTIAMFVARGRRNVISTFKDAHTVDILITKTQSRKVVRDWNGERVVILAGLR
jgi:peptidoglycan hydrolase-like protein with peptidoglycan-binding domain